MGVIIKKVAEVIRDLQTLGLVRSDPRYVTSTIGFDEGTKSRKLSVALIGNEDVLDCCMHELQKPRYSGIVMNFNRKKLDSCLFELTANFYEQ